MSFKSYALDRMRSGDLLEWDADGDRHWAFIHNGTQYMVRARVDDDGSTVRARKPRRLGNLQLSAVFKNRHVKPREPEEVPGPVELMSEKGPDVVDGFDPDDPE